MKTTLLTLLALFSFFPTASVYSQSDDAEERITKVAEEIERRRKERDERLTNGGAYQPLRELKDDSEIIEDLVFSNMPVSRISQFYADLSQKEVLLSSKVATVTISMKMKRGTIKEVVDRIEVALSESGVEVIRLDDFTVALVKSAESD